MPKPFFYIIPRTSSTSLTNYLYGCFGQDKVFVQKVVEDVFEHQPVTSDTPTPSLQRLRAGLQNHRDYKAFVVMAPFGVHRFVEEDVDLFVTLREPVERCASLIRFMRAKPELNSINALVSSHGDDLDGMLSEKSLICLRNEQTRMLGNCGDWTLTEASLDAAHANLARFAGVLDFRDYGKRLHSIARAYGVQNPPDYPKLNGAPKNLTLKQTDIKRLKTANSLDQRLYETMQREIEHAHE